MRTACLVLLMIAAVLVPVTAESQTLEDLADQVRSTEIRPPLDPIMKSDPPNPRPSISLSRRRT